MGRCGGRNWYCKYSNIERNTVHSTVKNEWECRGTMVIRKPGRGTLILWWEVVKASRSSFRSSLASDPKGDFVSKEV